MFPSFQECQVFSVDPNKRRVTVLTASGQQVEVRMGYPGPADAVRVAHHALPGRGSWGLCAFPYGDNRVGIWVCGTYPHLEDALTTETDPFMEYNSHWSGAYEMMDQSGQWIKSFPDGTFLQVSGSATKPKMYRHTVDQDQVQQLTEFTDSQRVPNKPNPRYLYLSHASGTTAQIDPKGNTSVTGAKDATFTITFNSATIVIDSNGSITATAANGQQFQANANNASVTIDKNGAIKANAAAGQEFQATANNGTITIDNTGGIEANAASGKNMKFSAGGGATSFTLVRTDLLVSMFNSHIHSNGNAGGNTGVPVTPITAGNIQSNIASVSE